MVLDIAALILISLAGLGAVALVAVALLTFPFLADWFTEHAAQVASDPRKLAVTVADAIRSGNVSYVQGIFDKQREKFTQVRRIKADEVDSDVQQIHSNHRVAIWD